MLGLLLNAWRNADIHYGKYRDDWFFWGMGTVFALAMAGGIPYALFALGEFGLVIWNGATQTYDPFHARTATIFLALAFIYQAFWLGACELRYRSKATTIRRPLAGETLFQEPDWEEPEEAEWTLE